MNKDLTIIFSSYQSQNLLKKFIKKFSKNFKIIIIENSLDFNIKKSLEKFKNVKVLIPNQNLGLARSYNLGIKNAKTKLVFLNNPDLDISLKSIKILIKCAKNIKNFGIISPTYKKEKVYKNYEIFSKKKIPSFNKKFKKYDITEVDRIDNNFLINKNIINKISFDENFFLYFETIDFSQNIKKYEKKIFVLKKVKFHHIGSGSIPLKFKNLVEKTRAFHFNWSKFYFYRKNHSYFYAIRKILPNFVKSLKKIFIGCIKFNYFTIVIGLIELMGIFSAIFFVKSFYRPKN